VATSTRRKSDFTHGRTMRRAYDMALIFGIAIIII